MKLVAECDSQDCLHELSSIIHDCTFRVLDVTYDPGRRTVLVPFKRAESVFRSWFSLGRNKRSESLVLEIDNADSLHCEDSQRIQTYNFNKLEYQSNSNLLIVRTGIPTTFEVVVESLLIKIYSPENNAVPNAR
jgi:hypothetical protein